MGCWEPGTWNWEFVEWGRTLFVMHIFVNRKSLFARPAVRPSLDTILSVVLGCSR